MRDILHVATATVYVATNAINGKRYIGATEKTVAGRAYNHLYSAKSGRPGTFYNAIRKHGEAAFTFSPLRACVHFFDALSEEARLIAETGPEYNMTAGGGGVKGLKFSEASRAKMSDAKRGKPNHWSNGAMPQELRDQLAAIRRSEAGRPLTLKQSVAMKQNARTANAARRRRVVCLNDGMEYESVSAAAAAIGVRTSTICNALNGRISRRGLQMKYREDG